MKRGEADLFSWGAEKTDMAQLSAVPFRRGSLRVLVSDCLFPGAPDALLSTLVSGKGRGVLFAPACAEESSPDWGGSLDMNDCESRMRRHERFDDARLDRYRSAYKRHFEIWQESARRRGVAFAQIHAEKELSEALLKEALPAGAVEPWT